MADCALHCSLPHPEERLLAASRRMAAGILSRWFETARKRAHHEGLVSRSLP